MRVCRVYVLPLVALLCVKVKINVTHARVVGVNLWGCWHSLYNEKQHTCSKVVVVGIGKAQVEIITTSLFGISCVRAWC